MKKSTLTICVFFAILISNSVFGQTDSILDKPFILYTDKNAYGYYDYSKNNFDFLNLEKGCTDFYVFNDSIISYETPASKYYIIKQQPQINDNGRVTLKFNCVDNNDEHCLFIVYTDHNEKKGYVQINYRTVSYKYIISNDIF